MNADTSKYYYLKDHLGSTRAAVNSRNSVRSAEDYDCWGYIMENRSYQPENSRYKFTGKERDRDIESNYDYFGARYYDSRIGRWGGVEPFYDNFLDITPYNYALGNPIKLVDDDGNGPREGQQFSWSLSPEKQISNAIIEVRDRFNSAIENFSNGNIGMGILETASLPTLALGLIPSDPLLDLAIPMGLVTEVSKTTTILKGEKKLVEFAEELSSLIGDKHSIDIGYGRLDLKGSAHFNKSKNILIETPHLHKYEFNKVPKTGRVFKKPLEPESTATFNDLKKAAKVIAKQW